MNPLLWFVLACRRTSVRRGICCDDVSDALFNQSRAGNSSAASAVQFCFEVLKLRALLRALYVFGGSALHFLTPRRRGGTAPTPTALRVAEAA
jgi:hypothetical protein